MTQKKKLLVAAIAGAAISLAGCTDNIDPNSETYDPVNVYSDVNRHVDSGVTISGSTTLTLSQSAGRTTIENKNVRVVLNENGSVREIANKQAGLYLVKDCDQDYPIRLDLVSKEQVMHSSVTSSVVSDTDSLKKIQFDYAFGQYGNAKATISLGKDDDQVSFRVSLSDLVHRTDRSVLDVEYPVIGGIRTLKEKTTDVFAAPYATGYTFENPIENFNNELGVGMGKAYSTYPTGWYYTMQFASYYSKNCGGFYWSTYDTSDTIKAFSFVGQGNDDLKLSIYHYVDDLSDTSAAFDYDFVIANQVEGRWQEAAKRYKQWALTTPWATAKGKLKGRSDINIDLTEKTSLAWFGFRCDVSTWIDSTATYDLIRSRLSHKSHNIAIYLQKNYRDMAREYGDQYTVFEFNSISPLAQFNSNAIKNQNYSDTYFSVNGESFYYQCPSSEAWLNNRNVTERGYYDAYNVDALYYDVAFTAVHPIQCFNADHSHGTHINQLSGFYHQLQNSSDLADECGFHSVGTEMLTERTLPYIDFYQARANGGPMGWMESDYLRPWIDAEVAVKIPMFDYVYSQNGAIRMDGYLVPDEDLGVGYYYAAAYTALNGGIPEFNYEYYLENLLPAATRIDFDCVDFIETLGQARCGFGKEYLVYGDMLDAPDCGAERHSHEYSQPNYRPSCAGDNGRTELSGTWTFEDIYTSAYKADNGTVGMFFANVTSGRIAKGFTVSALRDYGIEAGSVYITSTANKTRRKVKDFTGGSFDLGLNMQGHEVYMVEIVPAA